MALVKKLNQFCGRLSAEQVADGINAASENAASLLSDAKLLLEASRFSRAASLAALAIEEAGKVSILRSIALARTDAEAKAEWKNYRSHTRKNQSWLLPELAAKGARTIDEFRSVFDGSSDHPIILDQLKQLGFYTDCLGTAHWSKPSEVIDESLSRSLVEIASILAKSKRVSVREIELWVEHVGPVWKGEMAWMKVAVAKWYAAMQRERLVPEGENDMAKFLFGSGAATSSHSRDGA